jgi:long-subunit acyl-CoA synthetase (AMP-forming)
METQLDSIVRIAKERPNDIWLTQPMGNGVVKDMTFKEAMTEARKMASYLKSLDLPEKSQIALFSKNCAWWFLADLAIWMAGHVSVPLYPTLTAESIRQILDHSESRFIFIGKLDGWDGMKDGVPDGMPSVTLPLHPDATDELDTWYDVIKDQEPIELKPRPMEDLATIIYTSGSTGTPKGVMHTFETMASARAFMKLTHATHEERMLSYLPLAHVYERILIETGTFLVGFRIFFAESLDTFVQDLNRAKPTLFVSVPRLWQRFQLGIFEKMPPEKLGRLLKLPIIKGIVKKKVLTGLGLENVRFAASGSAPIPQELLDWYRDLGLELLEGYGMTENFALSHATRPGDVKAGFVGRAHDGVLCRISEEGEIQVKSAGDTPGYFKAPELTKDLYTEDGYIKTGDRGELDSEGRLKITGRVKELFKTSKGKYVAPAPIENRILTNDHVELACVSGPGQPQPYGLVMLSEAARKRLVEGEKGPIGSSLKEMLELVNKELDHHERLHFVVAVDDEWTIENGLLTPTMKLKRAAIEDKYGPHVDGWYAKDERVVFH